MLLLFKPKQSVGFHDQVCLNPLSFHIVPVPVPPMLGKWIKWIPNTDGSCVNGTSTWGGLVRDHNGSVILAFANNYGQTTSMDAEAKALLDGLQVCSQQHVQIKELEMDSFTLFSMLQDQFHFFWNITCSIRKCKTVLQSNVTLKHVYREGKKAADRLAAFGHSISALSVYSSLGSLPTDCKQICIEDRLGFSSFRKF